MRSDATVTVECDTCACCLEVITLTSIAGGGYDERHLDSKLANLGWKVGEGKDVCPDCSQENYSH